MDACFRCHDLENEEAAPGECIACHTVGFELKPESHLEAGFIAKHGEMAEGVAREGRRDGQGGRHRDSHR